MKALVAIAQARPEALDEEARLDTRVRATEGRIATTSPFERGFAARLAQIRERLSGGTPIELWWQGEARIGQQTNLTRRWARRGTRPSAPRDQRPRHAGIYAFGPATLTIAFTADGTGLIGQLTGQPAIPLTPIGGSEFRAEGVDATLVFEGAEGPSTAVTLNLGGQQIRVPRSGR